MTTINAISEASICNMALARMGSTQTITTLASTDRSNEAAQCRIWYPQDRDAILCDFPWPWAEAYAELDQVAGPEINGLVANAQWARSYRNPPDCLKIRRVVSTPAPVATSPPQTTGNFTLYPYQNQPWKRAVGNPYPISYGIGSDTTGRLIFSDSFGEFGAGLTCVYTAAVADPSQFAADFADTLAWRLAADLAMGLGFSDAKRQFAETMYERTIRKSRSAQENEQQSDIPLVRTQSEMINRRWNY